jgi:hypothetical protein
LTIVWTTLATLFLLMPGFAFIAGVNITDKNVREIVFRGTPAELAYVVAISLIVHTVFMALPGWPGVLIDQYANQPVSATNGPAVVRSLSHLIFLALVYVILSACVGGLMGLALGKAVAKRRWPIFIKHRWMVDLLGADKGNVVYARVLTSPKYVVEKDSGDHGIFVEGYISDCFFAADGTLLYLAFGSSQTKLIKLDNAAFAAVSGSGTAPLGAASKGNGRLLLEGRNVMMVRYQPSPAAGVSSEADLAKLAQAAEEDSDDGGGHTGV